MINAGFNPLNTMAEKTGKSVAQLKKEMSDGKLSAAMVQQAFIDATSEGGKYFGMAEMGAKTLQGQMSMLEDATTLMMNDIGQNAEGFVMKILKGATAIVENWEQVGDVFVKVAAAVGAYKAIGMVTAFSENKKEEERGKAILEGYNRQIEAMKKLEEAKKKTEQTGPQDLSGEKIPVPDAVRKVQAGESLTKEDADALDAYTKELEILTKKREARDKLAESIENEKKKLRELNGEETAEVKPKMELDKDLQKAEKSNLLPREELEALQEQRNLLQEKATIAKNNYDIADKNYKLAQETTAEEQRKLDVAKEAHAQASARSAKLQEDYERLRGLDEQSGVTDDNGDVLESAETIAKAKELEIAKNEELKASVAELTQEKDLKAAKELEEEAKTNALAVAKERDTAVTTANTASEQASTTASAAHTASLVSDTTAQTANSTSTTANSVAQNTNTLAKIKNTVATKASAMAQGILTGALHLGKAALDGFKTALNGIKVAWATNPIGLIATAAITAWSAFSMLNDETDEYSQKAKEIDDSSRKTRSEVEALYAILASTSKDTKLHQDALEKLTKTSKDYGITIDEEKDKLEQLIEKKEELLALIEEERRQKNIQNNIHKLQDATKDDSESFQEHVKGQTKGEWGESAAAAMDTEIRDNAERIAKLYELNTKLQNAWMSGEDTTRENLKRRKEIAKEIASLSTQGYNSTAKAFGGKEFVMDAENLARIGKLATAYNNSRKNVEAYIAAEEASQLRANALKTPKEYTTEGRKGTDLVEDAKKGKETSALKAEEIKKLQEKLEKLKAVAGSVNKTPVKVNVDASSASKASKEVSNVTKETKTATETKGKVNVDSKEATQAKGEVKETTKANKELSETEGKTKVDSTDAKDAKTNVDSATESVNKHNETQGETKVDSKQATDAKKRVIDLDAKLAELAKRVTEPIVKLTWIQKAIEAAEKLAKLLKSIASSDGDKPTSSPQGGTNNNNKPTSSPNSQASNDKGATATQSTGDGANENDNDAQLVTRHYKNKKTGKTRDEVVLRGTKEARENYKKAHPEFKGKEEDVTPVKKTGGAKTTPRPKGKTTEELQEENLIGQIAQLRAEQAAADKQVADADAQLVKDAHNAKTNKEFKDVLAGLKGKRDADGVVKGSPEWKKWDNLLNEVEKKQMRLTARDNEAASRLYQARKARIAEDKRLGDLAIANENRLTEMKIEAMEDGTAKELAKIEFDSNKKKQALEKSLNDEIEKLKNFDRSQWMKGGKDRKEHQWTQTISDEEYRTRAMKNIGYDDQTKQIEQGTARSIRDTNNKSAQAMRDFLKEYGDIEARRVAITKQAEEDIRKARLSGNADAIAKAQFDLSKQMEELNNEAGEKILSEFGLETLFTGLDSYTDEYLKSLEAQLRDFINSKEYKELNNGQKNKVNQRLSELQKATREREYNAEKNTPLHNLFGDMGGLMRILDNFKEKKRLDAEVDYANKDYTRAQALNNTAKTEVKMNERSVVDIAEKYGLGDDVRDVDGNLKDLATILELFNKKFVGADGALSEEGVTAVGEMSTATSKLSKSRKDAETANTNQQTAQNALEAAKGKLADFMKGAWAGVPETIMRSVEANIQGVLQLTDELGLQKTSFAKGLSSFAESTQYATKAFSALTSGDFIGGIANLLGAFRTLGDALGKWGIAGFGNSKKDLEKTNERLINSNEALRRSIDLLAKEWDKAKINEIPKLYEEQLQAQKSLEKNAKEAMMANGTNHNDGFLGIGGRKSASYKINQAINAAEWGKVSGIVGKTVRSATDLFNLSSEQMAKLAAHAPDIYQKILVASEKGATNAREYIEAMVELANRSEELMEKLRETMTTMSLEGFRGQFLSLMTDMNSTSRDFAKSFEDNLRNSIFNAVISNQFSNDIKALQDDWTTMLVNGKGTLDKDGVAKLMKRQDEISQGIIRERDRINKEMGWENNVQEQAFIGNVQSVTEETASVIEGRMTAMQMDTGAIRATGSVNSVALTDISGSILNLARYQEQSIWFQSNIERTLGRMNIHLQDINDNTRAVVTPIKEMRDELYDIKRIIKNKN